jgi:hypothetical protein
MKTATAMSPRSATAEGSESAKLATSCPPTYFWYLKWNFLQKYVSCNQGDGRGDLIRDQAVKTCLDAAIGRFVSGPDTKVALEVKTKGRLLGAEPWAMRRVLAVHFQIEGQPSRAILCETKGLQFQW